MLQDKKYFCYEIFKNIAVWSKDGNINYTPCSYSTYELDSSSNIDLKAVWNNEKHKHLKNLIESDLPLPGCEFCYAEEACGLQSRRLTTTRLYEEYFQDTELDIDSPQSIDYSVGNICNLKCSICGPHNSTAWNKDFIKLFPEKLDRITKFEKSNQIKLTNTADLEQLKNIHFHGGGEPLLTSAHSDLLKLVKTTKGLSDTHVSYNTNGTVTVSSEVLDLWSECRLVELYFSIDAVGDKFEYQRPGVSWNKIQDTIAWFKENMPANHIFKINCTWSYLNLFYLDEVVDWYKTYLLTNRLGDPTDIIFQQSQASVLEFDIGHISPAMQQALLKKFAEYPQLLNIVNSISVDEHADFTKVCTEIDKLDSIRDTKFKIIMPDFYQLLE
jgi:MoaA/NifB/PqqE/SkfB family radical SAM enzyme